MPQCLPISSCVDKPSFQRTFKLASPRRERDSVGSDGVTLIGERDLQSVYVNSCSQLSEDKTVIMVGSQRVDRASELFYAPVSVGGQSILKDRKSVV